MGKQGPCYHCGITSTPLWRNGPPEKPVLCNACGSRWRTKGTLTNYTPLHARENVDLKEIKIPKAKVNEPKLLKRKQNIHDIENEEEYEMTISDQNFYKTFEEDTSNRSSSGSAISYSESCSHFSGVDTNDFAGSVQCNFWDSLVPSRKRTCINRPKPSPVEKLTRDLYSILHEQSSNFSGSLEDELLYETETPIGSFEIGNGSVLIRQPCTAAPEEESEASSLPIDNKLSSATEAYSRFLAPNVDIVKKGSGCKTSVEGDVQRTMIIAQENVKGDRVSHDKLHILRSRDSPLSYVDLTEIINFSGFMRHLKPEEQQQLMKYLPSIDAARPPESLKEMFCSPQFLENISYFKQMVVEGILDMSSSGITVDECRSLKKLMLGNLTKSKWVEHYFKFKDPKNDGVRGKEGARIGPNSHGPSSTLPIRPPERQNQNLPEKFATNSPKRSSKLAVPNLYSVKSPQVNSSGLPARSVIDSNEYAENDLSFFSPRGFFASPPDRISLLNSFQLNDENSEQDLLLDVRSNASFPEAELLSESWKRSATLNSLSAESGFESIAQNATSCSTPQKPK